MSEEPIPRPAAYAPDMRVTMDEHLLAVASFMQASVPQSKILAVAEALPRLAGLLWGQEVEPEDRSLRLVPATSPAPRSCVHPRSPPGAT